jgi:hypothetical protein
MIALRHGYYSFKIRGSNFLAGRQDHSQSKCALSSSSAWCTLMPQDSFNTWRVVMALY